MFKRFFLISAATITTLVSYSCHSMEEDSYSDTSNNSMSWETDFDHSVTDDESKSWASEEDDIDFEPHSSNSEDDSMSDEDAPTFPNVRRKLEFSEEEAE